MRWAVFLLVPAWTLTLTACATRGFDTHPCGVSHVEASSHGLKVFFGRNVNENPRNGGSIGLSVTRAGSLGPPTFYTINHGRLEDKHFIDSDYLLLHLGDTAGTFHGFGGCDYVVEKDENGLYLDISGADGDLSDAAYSDWIRPESIILAYKPPPKIAELRADLGDFVTAVWTIEDEAVIWSETSTVKPPGDNSWNSSDPNWNRVTLLVRQDYLADTASTRPTAQEQGYLWERTVGLHLTDTEIDQLLSFYRSDVGKRFILLQHNLQPIYSDWISSLELPHSATADSPTNQTVAPQRNAIMKLALGEIAAGGTPPSDVPAVSTWAAIHYGPELDRLFAESEADIPAYQEFSRSPALLKLLSETGVAENKWLESKQGERWKTAVSDSVGKHLAEWKAALRAPVSP
jgi:hypothetical protein